jgi:hypothetical protein
MEIRHGTGAGINPLTVIIQGIEYRRKRISTRGYSPTHAVRLWEKRVVAFALDRNADYCLQQRRVKPSSTDLQSAEDRVWKYAENRA